MQFAYLGDTIRFKCNAIGRPQPKVHWYRGDQYLNYSYLSAHPRLKERGMTLEVRRIEVGDRVSICGKLKGYPAWIPYRGIGRVECGTMKAQPVGISRCILSVSYLRIVFDVFPNKSAQLYAVLPSTIFNEIRTKMIRFF